MPEPDQPGGEGLRLHLVVLRCQAGDDRAFAQLLNWFGERTLRYLSGLVGEDAEDVQQEVWLAVYRRIGGLSNPGAFRTWLFQTTRHRAIDFLRGRKREMRLIEGAGAELILAGGAVEEGESWSADEFDMAVTTASLPPEQREVLLLRYQNDMSYAEIAVVVGCSIGTVRSRLHQGKRRMKAVIQQGR